MPATPAIKTALTIKLYAGEILVAQLENDTSMWIQVLGVIIAESFPNGIPADPAHPGPRPGLKVPG